MTVNSFIPEIWAPGIFRDYDKATVIAPRCNRTYEGTITKMGDTVRINAVGPITINSYTKNSTSNITVQDLTDAQTVLNIDKADYFAFQLDSVDRVQATPGLMEEAMRKAGQAMAEDVDAV